VNLEGIVKELGAKRVGSYYMAPCLAHNDRNPSMSITERNGKTLIHCHAGCSQADVVSALKERGLWESDAQPTAPNLPFEERIVCAYDYTDETGNLLYQTVRLHSPKGFRPRYRDHDKWVYRKHPRQVLYHLPEVLDASIVFLVEGEKDVETLRSHGFVATTKAGGAKSKWLPEFTEALAGREVILIPDKDTPGRNLVLEIAADLLVKAARIIVLELEGAKDGTAWFEAGHSELELVAQVEGEAVSQCGKL